MRILIINDTRIENNPGCHATVNELIKYVKQSINVSKLETLSVGTSYNIFESNTFFKRNFFFKLKNNH